MIQAIVTGNLGRDPELKDTRTGKKMCTFSAASSMKRDGKDPETTWLDVVCFDQLAENVASTFRKGMKVVMFGQLSLESFKRKDGSDGVALRLVANEVGLSVRTKAERDESQEQSPQRQPQQKPRDEPW